MSEKEEEKERGREKDKEKEKKKKAYQMKLKEVASIIMMGKGLGTMQKEERLYRCGQNLQIANKEQIPYSTAVSMMTRKGFH